MHGNARQGEGFRRRQQGQGRAGVDKAADLAKDKLPDEHDTKVDKAADTLKGQIDKLDG